MIARVSRCFAEEALQLTRHGGVLSCCYRVDLLFCFGVDSDTRGGG
jgi:hypothetical protein